jgi:hypothetical protein
MVDIGSIIKDYCRQNGISLNALARQLDYYPTTLYRSLASGDMPLSRLDQISQALNHNFFIYFVQQSGSSEEQLLKLSTENRELTSKVASLQKEVAYLQEINTLLKINK